MLKKWQFVVLTGLSAAVLAAVLGNAWLQSRNRALQAELNGRAQFVQQSVQLEGLYKEIVKAIAELSLKNNDDQLKAVLNGQGITFSATAAGNPAAPAKPR